MPGVRLALVSVVVAALAAPLSPAFAADPCKPVTRDGVVTPCTNVPEAPSALVYPALGAGVLVVFAGAGAVRRRRRSERVAVS